MTSVADPSKVDEGAGLSGDVPAVIVREIDTAEKVERAARRVLRAWPAVLLFAILFGGWELWVRVRDIPPLYVPAPSVIYAEVAGNLGFFWSTRSRIDIWSKEVFTAQASALTQLTGVLMSRELDEIRSHGRSDTRE